MQKIVFNFFLRLFLPTNRFCLSHVPPKHQVLNSPVFFFLKKSDKKIRDSHHLPVEAAANPPNFPRQWMPLNKPCVLIIQGSPFPEPNTLPLLRYFFFQSVMFVIGRPTTGCCEWGEVSGTDPAIFFSWIDTAWLGHEKLLWDCLVRVLGRVWRRF